jgi:hypothetical protein
VSSDEQKVNEKRTRICPVKPAVETVKKVTFQKLFLKSGTDTLKSV